MCEMEDPKASNFSVFVNKEPGESDSVQRRRACLFATFTFLQTYTFSPHCWFQMRTSWMQMREGAANWLITLTAAKVELVVQKDFQENVSPLENLELVMLDPAISCLDRLGKPCYHFPRTRCGRLGRDCLCDNETRIRKQIKKTVTMRTIQILYIV